MRMPSSVRQLARTMYASHKARRVGAQIDPRSTDVDRRSEIGPGAYIAHHVSVRDSTIGRRTSIGRFSKIAFADIGSFCSISWDVTVGAVMHPLDRATTHAFPYERRVTLAASPEPSDGSGSTLDHARVIIENDVWLGAGCIILPGVRISNGAVVAAGAVVTKDVPPYTIVGGVPAKALRMRIPENLAERLVSTGWWNWTDAELAHHHQLFQSEVTDKVITALESVRVPGR